MRIIVCGDRNWDDIKTIKSELSQFPKDSIIIHGDCRGADKISGKVAKSLGMVVETYPAEWNKFGRSAGPKRNLQMLKTGVDYVIAFHSNIDISKGTKNMLSLCRKYDVSYILVSGYKVYDEIYDNI